MKLNSPLLSKLCVALLASCYLSGAQAAPKYTADVPNSITTPDEVETKLLGTLKFFDGMPDAETVEKAYRALDLTRGITAFLDGIRIASVYALLNGYREAGVAPGEIAIHEELMDARSLWLTPNTTTIYIGAQIDLSNGPVVVDAPAGLLGIVDDAAFEYVTDIGVAGPDKGKGGKYLFLPPGYEGDVPEGYFVAKSKSYDHWMVLRASLDENGESAGPVAAIKAGLNMYPLSEADNPPAETFHNMTGVQYNTIHANNFKFFEEINEVIQKEPAGAFTSEMLGTFASIGIKKGQPFAPDARMKAILTEAAAIGNATARALTFNPRDPGVFFYEDRKWNSPFQRQSYQFLQDGVTMLDDRTFLHYYATGITPAMTAPAPGTGSVYAIGALDSDGSYLNGGNTYSVTLPGPVPAKNFWSFMVYSGQHRSILETDQKSGGVDSNSPDIVANDDGSYTVWFAPEAPAGKEGNWVQTLPNKSFHVLLRLYGPLDPWFDKTWKPGDFELED
jgi:hypothetical protein